MRVRRSLSWGCSLGVLATWIWIIPAAVAGERRPNIVFILTDDQDNHMSGIEHMPLTQKLLQSEGTTFERHYCTVAICCPSRVNLWTGQLAHNTNVTNVKPPYGGYPKFIERGYNDKHLSYWLQQSGYNTYYTGKLYNGHTTENFDKPIAQGYTKSDFLLDPTTYQYYNFTATRNNEPVRKIVDQYSPDWVASNAYDFLDDGLEDESKPFFLTIAPIAPHCQGSGTVGAGPPVAADRHKHLYTDYQIPRHTSNFNPDEPSGVSWVRDMEQMNDTILEYVDEYQRQRLRSLQAVDEMVEQVVQKLADAGALENTHIFYTSDNGYHIGQHRLFPGKMLGFEEDIRVPLLWRGPGVPKNQSQVFPTSHSDLAPTIMKLAGLSVDDRDFDGSAIELVTKINENDENGDDSAIRSEHVGVEFWGTALAETPLSVGAGGHSGNYTGNTYKGLRIEAEDYGFYYSVWCTNESELYDMKTDPGQMTNLLVPSPNATNGTVAAPNSPSRWPIQQLVDRLDALTMVLKSCKGTTCTHPWRALHPEGDVSSLAHAMCHTFDTFYKNQPKVGFSECRLGYLLDVEGPQEFDVFRGEGGGELRRRQPEEDVWSFWT